MLVSSKKMLVPPAIVLNASHVSIDLVFTLISSPKTLQFEMTMVVLLNVPHVLNQSPILLPFNVGDNVLMFVLLALKK